MNVGPGFNCLGRSRVSNVGAHMHQNVLAG